MTIQMHRPKITDEQRANLLTLATYLAKGKTAMKFDMGLLCVEDCPGLTEGPAWIEHYPDDWECGTVGCALGHGPAAGVEALPGESWYDYACRAFEGGDWILSWWLFSVSWVSHDNTPQGAADRIFYFLETGEVPKRWGDTPAFHAAHVRGEYTGVSA